MPAEVYPEPTKQRGPRGDGVGSIEEPCGRLGQVGLLVEFKARNRRRKFHRAILHINVSHYVLLPWFVSNSSTSAFAAVLAPPRTSCAKRNNVSVGSRWFV